MSDCPRCGCNLSHYLRTTRVFGRESEVRECDHCATIFRCDPVPAPPPPPPPPPVVVVVKPSCPACGHKQVPVYSRRENGTQYRRCNACGKTFKTLAG
jgi:hypothetical protein